MLGVYEVLGGGAGEFCSFGLGRFLVSIYRILSSYLVVRSFRFFIFRMGMFVLDSLVSVFNVRFGAGRFVFVKLVKCFEEFIV